MILRKQLKNSKLGYHFIFAGALLISFTEIIRRYIVVGDFVDGLCIGIGIGLEILGIIALRKYYNSQRVSNQ
ncbi:hypothetical protein [Thermoanaerobacterium thermosaccharolyticum]|jgi:hypothetical protein|uniref:Uncharacterized protein n=1 Tax=Thermoanaerobacterium thermosaccharolyticum (strain ATCC 7956 / DSM 571 / NCIMB 9385 / NCA 3814 / NCTC 13789 / WDCM 00135 / 2032) TaxID=580327 RepID=D9TQQ5_THETC|nr:hypothetical protein [Thermoanaerobacterium thermosaccharolyticum]ADL67881.1 conserved hypothetical protein [Thermoanaerobacterium thermosaccharolyticum DSM 571]KAA5806921.1 hypothetical protein F1655_06700 [Thermoanaerobacterium thermosaccharolyticum]TCW42551.1 hypothetical protein EDC21_101167 [Thermohydrogenium kirishiense]